MTYLRRPSPIKAKSCGHCVHWRLISECRDWADDVGFCWEHRSDKLRKEVCKRFAREPGSDDDIGAETG